MVPVTDRIAVAVGDERSGAEVAQMLGATEHRSARIVYA
jgi:hypothetical protein